MCEQFLRSEIDRNASHQAIKSSIENHLGNATEQEGVGLRMGAKLVRTDAQCITTHFKFFSP